MPMLDEKEFADVIALFYEGARSVKEYRKQSGEPIQSVPMSERFKAMLARYESITGYKETNPNAIWHHRLSMYGPPCRHCGRPLRSPEAKLCGSCMAPRS